jgi:pyruvate,water dikinase
MESTMNTGLNYSVSSPYTKKNYFMVTRKYCSSHIHFGFHFSTVEALLGKRRAENYVRFNFKGGGAEEKRRYRRAKLVADILEEYDFRINIVGDTLMARIEKYGLEFTKQRLEIVGYLILHTRQLDMVLKNQSIVSKYKEKIRKDLKIVLQNTDAS